MTRQMIAADLATRYDLIAFDLDHTLIEPFVGNHKQPGNRASTDDWMTIPGRAAIMNLLQHAKITLAICTNQGGVAFGYHAPCEMAYQTSVAAKGLGIHLVYMCFDHPNGKVAQFRHDSPMRKPAPGMLWRAMQDAHVRDASRMLYVGDRDEDRQAATNAGCAFQDASAFFALFQEQTS